MYLHRLIILFFVDYYVKIPDVPLMNNETIIGRLYKDIEIGSLTPRYVDYMTQFLNTNKEEPFFLVRPMFNARILMFIYAVLCTGQYPRARVLCSSVREFLC